MLMTGIERTDLSVCQSLRGNWQAIKLPWKVVAVALMVLLSIERVLKVILLSLGRILEKLSDRLSI